MNLDPNIFGNGRPCSVPSCDRDADHGKYCNAHWQRILRGRPLDTPIHRRRKKGQAAQPCSVSGCYRESKSVGLCPAHYHRKRKGKTLDAPIQVRNPAELTTDFGVRVLKEADEVLRRQAKALRISRGALIRIILERWAKEVTSRKQGGF